MDDYHYLRHHRPDLLHKAVEVGSAVLCAPHRPTD